MGELWPLFLHLLSLAFLFSNSTLEVLTMPLCQRVNGYDHQCWELVSYTFSSPACSFRFSSIPFKDFVIGHGMRLLLESETWMSFTRPDTLPLLLRYFVQRSSRFPEARLSKFSFN